VGYCIAPEALTSEFRKVHQFNVFTVITPIQYALAAYLYEPEHYLTLPAFFQKKRDFLRSALEGTPFKRIDSRGTYFELYDYSAVSDRKDVDFVKELTIQYGVAAIPISVFYTDPDPDARIMRLCFGKTEQTLAAAAERLATV
jgi:methionine aminotransferase